MDSSPSFLIPWAAIRNPAGLAGAWLLLLCGPITATILGMDFTSKMGLSCLKLLGAWQLLMPSSTPSPRA